MTVMYNEMVRYGFGDGWPWMIGGGWSFLNPGFAGGLLVIFLVWSLFWKGLALWRAGRHNQAVWFVLLLVLNTLGIVEIIYLACFQKDRSKVKK